jgi:hypothetical protein
MNFGRSEKNARLAGFRPWARPWSRPPVVDLAKDPTTSVIQKTKPSVVHPPELDRRIIGWWTLAVDDQDL